jgi:hypothetical protein
LDTRVARVLATIPIEIQQEGVNNCKLPQMCWLTWRAQLG